MSRKTSESRFIGLILPFLLVIAGLLVVGKLYAGWIKVSYPNGGEVFKTGLTIRIQWQSQDIKGKVAIVLYKTGVKQAVISEQTDNSGVFAWKIAPGLPEGNDYRIRIRALEEPGVSDFSDRDFIIKK